jgi:hypothetical protein
MDARRKHLASSLLLVAVTGAIGFGAIRSPIRAILVVVAGLALFGFLTIRKPRVAPVRWFNLLVHIAVIQLLVILLFAVFARMIARLGG